MFSNFLEDISAFFEATPTPVLTFGDVCPEFITGRNEVVAKVIFLHLPVIHSVHRGVYLVPGCVLSPGGCT